MHPTHPISSALTRCILVATAALLGVTAGSVDDASAQGYGASVTVSGDEVFVGEPLSSRRPGTVYVYRKAGDGSWSEVGRIRASDAENGDHFGRGIAAEGDVLWAGATVKDSSVGAAYLFRRTGSGEWRQEARFQPDDLAAEEAFGRAAAMDGDFAMVASWGHDDGKGAVYVYRRDPDSGEWSQYDKLMADDAASDDWFGQAMDVRGDLAVVGAPRHANRTGAVYVFRHDADAGTWEQAAKIQAEGVGENARFGSSLLLDEGRVTVGAPGYDSFGGAVFRFDWTEGDDGEGEWEESARLLPFDGQQGARFGWTLARADGELWVGAPGASESGGIYRFRPAADGEGWAGASRLTPGETERGDRFAATLAVEGGVAVAGLPGDDYGAGTALIMDRDDGGEWAAAEKVFSELENYAAITGEPVSCGPDGMASHFPCQGIDLVSFLPISEIGGSRGVEMNDVWGWTDPETGREYALAGRVDGTAFVDITDPADPVYLGSLPLTEGARPNTWRDIKVYEHHAFVVADGAGDHGMQVFDLTRLRDVSDPPVTFDADAHYDRVASVHNIVINTESGFAYAVGASSGGETCGGGLHMIDVRDPQDPTFAGCFSDTRTGRQGTGYTHDAQCVIYRGPDEEYRGREICVGANETALSIADVTDKEDPEAVSMATYPNVGYTHQGWFGPDQRYFFMNDELDEMQGKVERTRTMVWDMTDLDDPIMAAEFRGPTHAIDHNLYVVGDRIFQSNYLSGLRVLDAGEPTQLEEIGYFDTVPYGENETSFGGSWSNYPFFESGNIPVTSGSEGLFIVRPTEEVAAPREARREAGPEYGPDAGPRDGAPAEASAGERDAEDDRE
jgi:choice-of-anchor B domain-containing protein